MARAHHVYVWLWVRDLQVWVLANGIVHTGYDIRGARGGLFTGWLQFLCWTIVVIWRGRGRGDRGRGVGCRFSEVINVFRDTFVNNLEYRWGSGAGVAYIVPSTVWVRNICDLLSRVFQNQNSQLFFGTNNPSNKLSIHEFMGTYKTCWCLLVCVVCVCVRAP